jgi:hypothetical protein
MPTKTWKIGEYCAGGIITAEVKGDKVALIGKQWDHAAGGRKSSQKNNKEWCRREVDTKDQNAKEWATQFLNELTTHYYAEKVMDWVATKVTWYEDPHGW